MFKALFFSAWVLKITLISLLWRGVASTTPPYSFLLSCAVTSVGVVFSFRSGESVFACRVAETRSGGGGGWFEGLGVFWGLRAAICA